MRRLAGRAISSKLEARMTVSSRLDVGSLSVDSKLRGFGRYKDIESHEVRKQKAVGNRLEAVGRTREMLRGMTAEQLLQVIEFHDGLNFIQVLTLARREGKLIVPSYIHDTILNEIKDKEALRQLYKNLMWTGTLVIYEEPYKKFGETLVFRSEENKVEYFVSFEVPKQFQGLANCALAIEHPDFELVDLGNNRYEIKLDAGVNINLIESFPVESDKWHIPHQETMIPQGEPIKESNDARHLLRRDGCYIGSVGYGIVYDYVRRHDFLADSRWFVGSMVGMVSLVATPKQELE